MRNRKTLLVGTILFLLTLCAMTFGQKAELIIPTGHNSDVQAIAFSPDGSVMASSEYLNNTKLWDVKTGRELRTFVRGEDSVQGGEPVFSPDGKTLATFNGRQIRLWNWRTGQELLVNQMINSAGSFAFSPDGSVLAVNNYAPDVIKLWDLETGKELRILAGHTALVSSIAFSSDGKTLASDSSDQTIKLWNWQTGEQFQTISAYTCSVVSISKCLAFSPDGKTVAAKVVGKDIIVWDVKNGQIIKQIGSDDSTMNGFVMENLTFSPNGKSIAEGGYTVSGNKIIKLWNIETGRESGTIQLTKSPSVYCSIAFSPDSKIIAAGEGKNPTFWDVATNQKLQTFTGYAVGISATGLSADGSLLGIARNDGSIKIWNLQNGKEVQSLQGHAARIEIMSFSQDGKLLASSDSSKTIKIWEIAAEKELKSLSITDPASQKQVEALVPEYYRGSVSSLSDGKISISAGLNGNVIFYQAKDYFRPLLSLVLLNENDWVAVTPEGLFDASPGARDLIYYTIGLEKISLEQMKDIYYVPGLLQKIIKGEPLPKVELFSEKDLFPDVEFTPLKAGQKQLSIKLTNRGGGIGQVQVLVNGKEFILDARPANFDSGQQTATISINLADAPFLVGKENKIEIVTRNAAGSLNSRGSSRGSEIVQIFNYGAKSEPPNIYAIVGGISNYTGDNLKLNFAAKDAEDFAKAFEVGASKLFGAGKVHLRLLTSSGDKSNVKFSTTDARISTATKADFARAFNDFKNATPNDIFIVYLAGHGVSLNLNQNSNQPGGDTYLYLTQEATTSDKSVLAVENSRKAMTISSDELTELMKGNKALKQVLVLDTCAAGAAANSLTAKRDLPSDQIRAIDRLNDRTGFFVLMGAASDKVSYEASQYGQGLLTYALLQGMKGARLRENQYADVGALFGYAADTVPEMAKNIGGIQRPLVIAPDTGNSFDIGKFTAEEQKQIALTAPKPIILRPNLRNSVLRFDNLKLTQMLTERLREMNYPQSRGASNPLVFVETDEMTDAILPSGDYTVEGDTIKISLVLVKNNFAVGKEINITGNAGDPAETVERIIKAIITSL